MSSEALPGNSENAPGLREFEREHIDTLTKRRLYLKRQFNTTGISAATKFQRKEYYALTWALKKLQPKNRNVEETDGE